MENGWIKEAAEYASTRYNQMFLTSLITPENLEAVKAAVAAVGAPAKELFVLNTEFLGINLFQQPTLKFFCSSSLYLA